MRPDQQGFIAGVIAALITSDWRVGVLGPGDSAEARAARLGFLNGAVYFCGLCLPYHGPSVDYPLYQELPSGASVQEAQLAVQALSDQAVKTIYLPAGVLTAELVPILAQLKANLIGSGAPPAELAPQWAVTIQSDPLPGILEVLPLLLAGQGGHTRELALLLSDVNPDLLSEGRQARAQEILADLLDGYIDTGVDPLSGESR